MTAALIDAGQALVDFDFDALMRKHGYAAALREYARLQRDLRIAVTRARPPQILTGNADLLPPEAGTGAPR